MERRIRYRDKGVRVGAIGEAHGLTREEIFQYQPRIDAGHRDLFARKERGELGFLDLPFRDAETGGLVDEARRLAQGMENCLVLGIGGSSLGGKALRDAMKTPLFNLMPPTKRRGPRLFFAENVDPESIATLLTLLPIERTLVVVISKSGGTAETMSQFLILFDRLKRTIGPDLSRHLVAITDPEKGALREIARAEGLVSFDIPENVGGRFSVLTPVGLFPAAVIGIDIVALLKGARDMAERCHDPDLETNIAYLNAVIHYHYDVSRAKPLSVLMPYTDSLLSFADWYRQLYAESLGKRYGRDGREIFSGPTPIRALGVTDQHSQLQLYIEGPFDKVITFLRVDHPREDVEIPNPLGADNPLDYLSNHTLGQLLGFEQRATAHALMESQRPVVTIDIPEICEFTLGQLFYFYELQVAMMGELYGIDAFNQPGVERGKILTYGLMGRKGYTSYVKDLNG